uniref:Deoxyribonuclease n=1 Tax=Pelodiscus sinensis TaxID=13735 RepID=K7F8E0_PELSI|nr:deoxyribonuclease gamma [Pelodiscus sinensis]|eukprot:XP_006130951.1 deoxyribonuclease gamma [Pelodiscus sinensis]
MLCISLFLFFFFNATLSIKICSFNVRSFGEAKRAKPEVLDVIIKVISRCDIMLLMEIKDNSNKICPLLIEKLNGQFQEKYNYVISERLGRKSYKEQYAFIYRSNVVSVKQTYQYPDTQPGDVDAFSREPFVVWFQSSKTVVKEFVIIPQHTTPETAVREIDELYDVYLDVKQRWKSENFIFMGDFNAACGYVPKKHWKNIRLRTHTEFVWLIGDKKDTTVRNSTNCAYDRIVIHGEKLISAVVPNSADIFDFQNAFGMTEEQALEVSDHFPVEFELKTTRGFFSWLRSLASKKRKSRNLHLLPS